MKFTKFFALPVALVTYAAFFPTVNLCMDQVTAQYAKANRDAMVIAVSPARYYPRKDQMMPSVLVLHYTEVSLASTLDIFLNPDGERPVASHYTISEDGYIILHVPELLAARHAGVSEWRTMTGINDYSIGIEHVNLGFQHSQEQPDGILIPGMEYRWYPFAEKQIAASMRVCKKIIDEHAIEPRNVVSHGDIAPGRKIDPGPLFPWKRFAEAGIGAWPASEAPTPLPCFTKALLQGQLSLWIIDHLHIWGYKMPDASTNAQDIVRAFQMHFRPSNISGEVDEETARILDNLLQTYGVVHYSRCLCCNTCPSTTTE